jgi:2-keto-4-pentenoate hydratase/2-oxohepta-3-ene-1,7-dioic acid hydratase in catechol pathway
VFIARGGSNIQKNKAMEHVGGYLIALDLTDKNF